MNLTAVINPVVPLNILFPLQRVIFPQSRQSVKYRMVTHNFTNDNLTNGKSPSYHLPLHFCFSFSPFLVTMSISIISIVAVSVLTMVLFPICSAPSFEFFSLLVGKQIKTNLFMVSQFYAGLTHALLNLS